MDSSFQTLYTKNIWENETYFHYLSETCLLFPKLSELFPFYFSQINRYIRAWTPNIYTVPEAEFKSSSAMVNPFVSSLLVLIETPKGGEQSNNKEEYSIVANRHSGKFETFS